MNEPRNNDGGGPGCILAVLASILALLFNILFALDKIVKLLSERIAP